MDREFKKYVEESLNDLELRELMFSSIVTKEDKDEFIIQCDEKATEINELFKVYPEVVFFYLDNPAIEYFVKVTNYKTIENFFNAIDKNVFIANIHQPRIEKYFLNNKEQILDSILCSDIEFKNIVKLENLLISSNNLNLDTTINLKQIKLKTNTKMLAAKKKTLNSQNEDIVLLRNSWKIVDKRFQSDNLIEKLNKEINLPKNKIFKSTLEHELYNEPWMFIHKGYETTQYFNADQENILPLIYRYLLSKPSQCLNVNYATNPIVINFFQSNKQKIIALIDKELENNPIDLDQEKYNTLIAVEYKKEKESKKFIEPHKLTEKPAPQQIDSKPKKSQTIESKPVQELKEKDNLKQEEKLQKSKEELKDLNLTNIMLLPVAKTPEQKAQFTNKCDEVIQDILELVQSYPETILLHLDNPNMKNIIEYASKNFKFNFDKFMEENSSLVLENFDKQAIKNYYKNHPDKLENFLQKILASNTQNEDQFMYLTNLQDFLNANQTIGNQTTKNHLNGKIKKF